MKINLCSGGMDSYLAWRLFEPEARNVYVRIAHRYQGRELRALMALSALDPDFKWSEVEGPHIGHLETPSGIIPMRNALLLLTAAAAMVPADGQVAHAHLLLGALDGEINSDKSPELLEAVERVLDLSWRRQYWTGGVSFKVYSPVRMATKADLIRLYARRGGDMRVLAATCSCYSGSTRDDSDHCGACPACVKRWIAFRAADVTDPTRYAAPPPMSAAGREAYQQAQAGGYGAKRMAETLAAFSSLPVDR